MDSDFYFLSLLDILKVKYSLSKWIGIFFKKRLTEI